MTEDKDDAFPSGMNAVPLRVAVVTTFYPPCNFGGDGRYVQSFVHALARAGCEVEVIYDADAWRVVRNGPNSEPAPPPEPQPGGVTVHQLESRWPLSSTLLTQQTGRPIVQRAAIESILARGFDVIHYHNISLVGGPGVLALGNGIKLYTAHEHWLVCPNHILWRHNRELCNGRECFRCSLAFRRPPQAWRHTSLLEDSLEHVDALIALSHSVAENHRAFGLKRDMVPMASFMPDSEAKQPPASPPPVGDRPYFLFVGRLEMFKGLQDVIPCFDSESPADLVIAGSGDFEPDLRALAEGRECVKFLGSVDPGALPELYRGATALIAPSLCYEVFPMVALEAFREATPVVAGDLGPYRQIVEESEGGLLFDDRASLASALAALTGDRALRDRLGSSAKAALETRWSETTAIGAWLDLVRSLALKKGNDETVRRIDALSLNPGSRMESGEFDDGRAPQSRHNRDNPAQI
ncbi:MAG: glycosyltransferase family 4 protein [Sphingomonadales bacterium]|nr:glycosyltransferase family 4 protein [Sphingomonadales bacterium]